MKRDKDNDAIAAFMEGTPMWERVKKHRAGLPCGDPSCGNPACKIKGVANKPEASP